MQNTQTQYIGFTQMLVPGYYLQIPWKNTVDSLGYQKMLANETVATWFSTVKREIHNKKIHE